MQINLASQTTHAQLCSVMLSRPAGRSTESISISLDCLDTLTRFQNIVLKRKNLSIYWRLYGTRKVSNLDVGAGDAVR